jgi:hypothetical protein
MAQNSKGTKNRTEQIPVEDKDKQQPIRGVVVKTQEGKEFDPVQPVGKSRFAGLRTIYRAFSTLLITIALSLLAWWLVVPSVVVQLAAAVPFRVSEGLYSALFGGVQCILVLLLAVLVWLLGPELMFMPRDMRLVTKLFGVVPWSRGGWGIFFLLKPFEWPDSIVDVRAFAADFLSINTSTADGVPIRANATALVRIVRPETVVFGVENLRKQLSSAFEPVMEARLSKERYPDLQANKATISEDLLTQVKDKLGRLEKKKGFDIGIEVATFELKDTPISDNEVRDLYASLVGIRQRASGRRDLMQADIDYLSGLTSEFMSKDSGLDYRTALEMAMRMAEREAWEQGGALGQRGLSQLGARRGSE